MATSKEFEEMIAKNLGKTVEQFHVDGLAAVPCDCGEDICQGWQIGDRDDLILTEV